MITASIKGPVVTASGTATGKEGIIIAIAVAGSIMIATILIANHIIEQQRIHPQFTRLAYR